MHDSSIHPESPEGDIILPADFTCDGKTNKIKLANPLAFGKKITVVRKKGVAWDSTTNIMVDDSKIARFLKAEPGIWFRTIDKYETKPGIAFTLDNVKCYCDNDKTTLDQG